MNELKKYVVSRTLTESDLEWNTELLPADDIVGAVRRLKDQGDGDIQVMGSASLARYLIANDLVDEYNLMIEPIVLGGGKTIFPDDAVARPLELVSVRQAKTGVQVCKYRPAS